MKANVCQRRKVVAYHVEPEGAWRTVVLNLWRILSASCFDIEVEMAGVHYKFVDVKAQSWNERPVSRPSRPRRR